MATTHDKLITRKQAARLIGCTERTLSRHMARESDPLRPTQAGGAGKATLFDPRAVADWWHRQELAKLQQAAGHDDPIDYLHERARLTKAQADKEEIKVAALRRQFADTRLISFALGNFGSQASAILETLPGRIKRLRPDLDSSDMEAIKAEMVKLQNLCAHIEIDWTGAPEVED
jgi:phage terminase Nu1 subunit (DNA packaging protein)